jgi:asparagine synthase (glutamine-hydrolysing)
MCGIAGFLASPDARMSAKDVLLRQTDCLCHRGPDADGQFHDDSGIALGHRRLAIVDLSPEGRQPMVSASGRWVIVFNGEIYNYRNLSAELAASGTSFRGHSDTEVMLAAIDAWGLIPAVKRFVGIFAFAIWDRANERLHLVRDHLGVKPLYYGRTPSGFVFGSELRAIEAFPGFTGRIDRNALALLLRHNCIPAPYSIYEGVAKLPPGTILTVSRNGVTADDKTTYWSAAATAQYGQAHRLALSDDAATDALDALLTRERSPPTSAPIIRSCTSRRAWRWTWFHDCRSCTTSHFPTRRRFRRFWSLSSPDNT